MQQRPIVLPARTAHPKDKPKVESQCADRPAVDPRGLAPSDLFHPGGLECRDSHVPRRGQCPADADRGHEPAGALRAARSAGAPPAAGQPLRAGDVEALSCEYRRSRRGRAQLVQRAVSARARPRRGARHADDRRSLLERPAGRVTRAAHRPGPLLHPGGAHAAGPSRPRRMDPVPPDRVGRPDRPRGGSSPASSNAARIPSRAIARVSGSCGWAGSTGWTGSTPPVRAPSGSAPTAIARSSTFSPTSRTGSRSTSPRLRDPP